MNSVRVRHLIRASFFVVTAIALVIRMLLVLGASFVVTSPEAM